MTDHDFLTHSLELIHDRLAEHHGPEVQALPTDKWIARSALQKAIRRGEEETAARAVTNVLQADRRSAWRALTVIALEDAGIGSLDLVGAVAGAACSAAWRQRFGGEQRAAQAFARILARANHCQAVCDLLMRAEHDPHYASDRVQASEMDRSGLEQELTDRDGSLVRRAIAVLAARERSGGADAVLELTSANATARAVADAAWRVTGNPMALLLPMIDERSRQEPVQGVADDPMPEARLAGSVPLYAVDQFTRLGREVLSRWCAARRDLRTLLGTKMPPGKIVPVAGDLVFLAEGGLLTKRLMWTTADELAHPWRPLPGVMLLDRTTAEALALTRAGLGELGEIRAQLINTSASRQRSP